MWDVASGAELRTITQPSEVDTLAFAPDGKTIASAGPDGRLYLNPLDDTVLMSLAQHQVTRQLTADECQQYVGTQECSAPL